MPPEIVIYVGGCVASPGRYALASGSTVRQAVKAAGGLGAQGMQPTGVISIRCARKSDGLGYLRRRLFYLRNPSDLDVELRTQDLAVVVQFDVESYRPPAT